MRLKTGTFLSPSIYTVDAIICIINPRLVSQAEPTASTQGAGSEGIADAGGVAMGLFGHLRRELPGNRNRQQRDLAL